ncbi:MAG: ribosome assembly factor SBDS [Candidatus Aenigmarchaeota archaeon]|nr:ribosome assembly factor SBDS [Candidatus Aenigmarchaeota archaeon]
MAVSLDNAVIARLAKAGEKFEIWVDPVKAHEFRKGKDVKIEDILAYPGVFRDAHKADRIQDAVVQKIFGTIDAKKIAEKILKEGEIQLTTEQRRKMVEDKRNQIANMIARNAVNPQTNAPHPAQRIINAMDEAGVHVDPMEPAQDQVDGVVKAIKTLLPIKIEVVTIELRIPAQYAGKASSIIRGTTSVKRDSWGGDGSYTCVIEVPAGLAAEMLQRLNKITEGKIESKELKTI